MRGGPPADGVIVEGPMLRVFDQWRVPPGRREAFIATWQTMPRRIHQSVPGARGSLCLQAIQGQDEIVTMALWDSEEQWRTFIPAAKATQIKPLHDIATKVSVEAFHQIADETVSAPGQP